VKSLRNGKRLPSRDIGQGFFFNFILNKCIVGCIGCKTIGTNYEASYWFQFQILQYVVFVANGFTESS